MPTYDAFQTSPDLETKGSLLDLADAGKFWIARPGGSNGAYVRTMEKYSRRYKKEIQHGLLSEDLATELLHEVYAETVVVKWEDVTNEKGIKMVLNKKNCMKLFKDLPEIFNRIRVHSEEFENYRLSLVETSAGN